MDVRRRAAAALLLMLILRRKRTFNPLRPGVHLSVQNINCCWLGTGPVEYFCCADLLQVVGIDRHATLPAWAGFPA